MKKLASALLLMLFYSLAHGQTSDSSKLYYQQAFEEIKGMLEGDKQPSFKRAVFVTENAYFDNSLSYEWFNEQIEFLAYLSKRVIAQNTLEYDEKDKDEVLKKFAAFRVLKDSITFIYKQSSDSASGFQTIPYTYDFEDFWGEKDWSKMFVTKLLNTRTGNCHSLPFLYKILAEELGTSAYLAMSPNHTYIKQWTKKTGWFNTELTSGQFPIDAWIMASGYIKVDAVVNGLYMDTLSTKQSLAVNLTDLAQGYQKKFGKEDDEFTLKCLDMALKYYPNYVNAMIMKAEINKKQYEDLMERYGAAHAADLWHKPEAKALFDNMQSQYLRIHNLGYRRMPKEMYLNWLLDIKEKDTNKKMERFKFTPPQPFEEYGYKVKVATASNGKYQEFFDLDTLVQIGSVVMNTQNGQITSFVEYDTVYSEATLEPEVISKWLSPDPLAEEFYSWSPYNFVYNNPIRFTDPTGLFPIDYYDQEGNHIGTDGNDDGRVVVVTDKQEKKQIKKANRKGGTTSLDQVSSGVELPSAYVRSEMGKAVDRTGDPSFHEEGGYFGTLPDGSERVVHAEPGQEANPETDPHASINVWKAADQSQVDGNMTIEGTFHTHPNGTVVSRPGSNTIGGTTTTSRFQNEPSNKNGAGDIPNAKANASFVRGNSYVLSQGNNTVYIYNGNGTVAKFPLKEFRTIGVKK